MIAPRSFGCLLLACLYWLPVSASSAETEIIAADAYWRYLDDGSNPGPFWAFPFFDSSSWPFGRAQLGYGDGDETTTLSYGPDPNDKYITTYFRRTFPVVDPNALGPLDLRIRRDDGAVVYVNGTEVWRSNLPPGQILPTTWASPAGSTEDRVYEVSIPRSLLFAGLNVVAVEIHQSGPTSSDLSMEATLTEASPTPPLITRGPYLQMGTDDSVSVHWRTDVPHPTRLRYRTSAGKLDQLIDDEALKTQHQVRVTALASAASLFYSVGTTAQPLSGGVTGHATRAAPARGAPAPTRIWVQGDAGTGNATAAAVRDGYNQFAAGPPDVWLMLGDNAYQTGTETEFQNHLFDMFPAMLRSTTLWPSFGNHDQVSSSGFFGTGPYFDAFELPTAAELGGAPSGKEAYYSFDHGDIHFIVLDSQSPAHRVANSPMETWLSADLAANQATWTIAFFHHPVYSKGSHDSDTEQTLIDMRQLFLPALEAGGVDLVLAGHSHSYERSFFLNGHHGSSTSLTSGMVLDAGDGDPDGDGAYRKNAFGREPNRGAVFLAMGNSGSIAAGSLNHPVMVTSLGLAGSLVVDVAGGRLEGQLLDQTGTVQDRFVIEKNTECNDGIDNDGDGQVDAPADAQCDSPTDLSERPGCGDGLDNDGDGLIDFPQDPGCGTTASNMENPPSGGISCGLGPELALALPLLAGLRRRTSKCRSRGARRASRPPA